MASDSDTGPKLLEVSLQGNTIVKTFKDGTKKRERTPDALEFLQELLRHEETQVQLEGVSNGKLSIIARALGPSRCISELVPFLQRYCFPLSITQAAKSQELYSNTRSLDAREEVISAIAEALNGDMLSDGSGGRGFLIQRSAEDLKGALSLLEQMCQVEETVIRFSATSSLGNLLDRAGQSRGGSDLEYLSETVKNIFENLCKGEFFSSRVSAAALAPYVYDACRGDRRNEQSIIADYNKLCKDDMPMVKTEAFKSLPVFVNRIKNEKDLLQLANPLCKVIKNCLQESTRLLLVDIVSAMVKNSINKKTTITLIEQCVNDESWRVRKKFVNGLPELIDNFSQAEATNSILKLYVGLLQDITLDVKVAALNNLPKIIHKFDAGAVEELLPGIYDTIFKEASENDSVREAIASSFISLGSVVSSSCVKQTLLPMMVTFLQDELVEVKLKFCNSIGEVVKIIDRDTFMTKLKDAIMDIGKDTKYRARLSVVGNLHHICDFLGVDKWAGSEFEALLTSSFTDPAAAVRKASIQALKGIVALGPTFWDYVNTGSTMKALKSPFADDASQNYHHRLAGVYFFRALYKGVRQEGLSLTGGRSSESDQQIKSAFQEMLVKSLRDDVPNVKVQACQVALEMAALFQDEQEVTAALEECVNDEDLDVQEFARRAQESINDW